MLAPAPCAPQIADLMREGKLTAHIDRVMPLEETAAAHEYAEKSRTVGKLVLKIKE